MPQIIPMEQMGTITPNTTAVSQIIAKTQAAPLPDTKPADPPQQVTQPTAEDKAKQLDSSRFAALSRKERENLRISRELKAERQRIEQERVQYAPLSEAQKLASEGKGLEAIKKLGFDYDKLTQEALNQLSPTPEHIAQQTAEQVATKQLDAYKQEQAKLATEAQNKAYQDALRDLKRDAKRIVQSEPEKFAVVNSTNSADTAVEVMEEIFRLTGELIPLEEAISGVNEYYEEGILDVVSKLPGLQEKIKNNVLKLTQEPKSQAAIQPIQKSSQQTINKPVASTESRSLTSAQKRQNAMDIFYGRPPTYS